MSQMLPKEVVSSSIFLVLTKSHEDKMRTKVPEVNRPEVHQN